MLDEKNENVNKFPLDVFPTFFKDLIIDLNKSLHYPIDYSGTVILTAVSTAIGTSVKMSVKKGWDEYPAIYCCLIGNAGANKTHPINTLFSPLKYIDAINHEIFVKKRKEYAEYVKLSKTEKRKVHKVEEPMLEKHILTSFTNEVLFRRLNENARGCAICSDEMVTFFEGINNYSKGDQQSIYLSMYNNQPTTIDRVGEPVPMFIKTPFLSIIGGLQPRIIGNAFPVQKMNNGFFQRFLFAYPENLQKEPFNDNEIDENLMNKYNKFIANFIDENKVVENNGSLNSRLIYWSEDARQFYIKWNLENCSLVNEHAGSIKSEVLTKYDNHFIRLATILQIMENPKSSKLDLKIVENAKKLCDYYIECAFKVLELLQSPDTYLNSLPENKKLIFNELGCDFTTSEALSIGLKYELAERRTKEFLTDSILFIRIKHGHYRKKSIKNN